jgi:hypothetical protein
MTKYKITEQWTIEIDNSFQRRVDEEGDLIFATKDKTVRLAVWGYKDQTRQEIYDEHKIISTTRDDIETPTLETFDLSDDNAARIGYMIEEADGEKKYKVIYAFTIVDADLVQAAIYFDNDSDKRWALDTWRTIRFN